MAIQLCGIGGIFIILRWFRAVLVISKSPSIRYSGYVGAVKIYQHGAAGAGAGDIRGGDFEGVLLGEMHVDFVH
jgi:hypothetical protein